jgi:hypothetical protein
MPFQASNPMRFAQAAWAWSRGSLRFNFGAI